MKTRKGFILFFFLFSLLLSHCGVSENTLPMALPDEYNTLNFNFTVLQTNSSSQIGEEFIIAPSVKSSWGIGNGEEISAKIFGLGFGGEFKQELTQTKDFVLSLSAEGDFSFPMISPLISKASGGKTINQDFTDFTSNAFYFVGGKINTGLIFDTFVIAFYMKTGYLDNAGFLPDVGTSNIHTTFPGFIFQPSLALFLKDRKSLAYLNFEVGYIFRLDLLYLSGSYAF